MSLAVAIAQANIKELKEKKRIVVSNTNILSNHVQTLGYSQSVQDPTLVKEISHWLIHLCLKYPLKSVNLILCFF